MPELETREQALAYLAAVSPTETFQVHPFENGWVCTKVPRQDQIRSGETVGMARLVIDSETGVVYQYPSWPTPMIAEAYTEAKRTGHNRAGRQIYPHQWTATLRKIREDAETIEYRMTVESLSNPPEPSQEHGLLITKRTLQFQPTDPLSSRAMAHAEWMSRQNQGEWPETDEIRV